MRRLIYCLFALLNPLIFHGQRLTFNHLTTENGLQNGNVRAICEDFQGFIWIATEDGLHRYDGYDLKIYRHQEHDTTTISSNFVLTLYEDSFNNLWAGTIDEGLCLYNRKKDNFITYKHKENDPGSLAGNTIRSFFQASDQNIYVGSSGFNKIVCNKDNSNPIQIENIQLPSWINVNPLTRILSIIEIRKGILWLCVNNFGVIEYNIRQNTFKNTAISELDKNIQSLYVDKTRNLVWAGTWNHGLVVIDPVTNRYFWHQENGTNDELQTNLQISQIKSDQEGNIWLGTDYGLSYFHAQNDPFMTGGFITYLPERSISTSIIGTAVKAIYIDKYDRIWSGAYFEGINIYDKNVMSFGFTDLGRQQDPDLLFPNVTAIIESKPGQIWIGCDGQGLFNFSGDLNSNEKIEFSNIPLFIQESKYPITKIKTMVMDKSGILWIGTWGNGLIFFNTKTKECQSFQSIKNNANTGDEIISLSVDDAENLWIGTFDNGLFRYELKSGIFVDYAASTEEQKSKSDRINVILADNNITWVGKEASGLNKTNPGNTTYTPVRNDVLDPSNTITALFHDNEDNLWIGVLNRGLVKYNVKSQNCQVFGEEKGLANNVIHSMMQDSSGRLWLSTNLGLSVFDKQKSKFTNFDKANGLLGNQFNHGSSATLSNGTMLFGNTRGINFFNPENYSGNSQYPNTVFTNFALNNILQTPNDPNSILKENITTAGEIRLHHYNNSFTVTYASLDFTFSNQTEFAYRLDGFDRDWQYVGTRRQASYTNLDPGNYILKVKASNAEKDWPEKSFDLAIKITPAWWQTNMFKIALFAGILLMAIAFHKIRINYLVAQKEKLAILVKEKTKNLDETNHVLRNKIVEINEINKLILDQKNEIFQKNDEIQAQNEELISQNEQISVQREELILAQEKLRSINDTLEKLVNEKTEALQSTIKKLNKTVFELDRFVYSASHDLMAPLKSIRGLVKLTEIEQDHSRISEYLRYINDSIFKLEEVIKSLAEYSRNTHQEFNLQDINLYELICEVKGELTFLPNASIVKFYCHFDKDITVNCDRTRLKIILHNLINNGIKYADPDKDAELTIDFSETKDQWQLIISDNGIGIEEKYIAKIFNMYFRATDKTNGSGLGLFIVKEVVDKLGGSIGVKSEFGQSASFAITLPKIIANN